MIPLKNPIQCIWSLWCKYCLSDHQSTITITFISLQYVYFCLNSWCRITSDPNTHVFGLHEKAGVKPWKHIEQISTLPLAHVPLLRRCLCNSRSCWIGHQCVCIVCTHSCRLQGTGWEVTISDKKTSVLQSLALLVNNWELHMCDYRQQIGSKSILTHSPLYGKLQHPCILALSLSLLQL